jgi:hypothetical protein
MPEVRPNLAWQLSLTSSQPGGVRACGFALHASVPPDKERQRRPSSHLHLTPSSGRPPEHRRVRICCAPLLEAKPLVEPQRRCIRPKDRQLQRYAAVCGLRLEHSDQFSADSPVLAVPQESEILDGEAIVFFAELQVAGESGIDADSQGSL